MAKIQCDCGCGTKVERVVYASNTCRMRHVRGGAQVSHDVRANAQEMYVITDAKPVTQYNPFTGEHEPMSEHV